MEVAMTLPADATDSDGAEPVAVRAGNLFATTFHPELTEDARLHAYFLAQCVDGGAQRNQTSARVVAEGGGS